LKIKKILFGTLVFLNVENIKALDFNQWKHILNNKIEVGIDFLVFQSLKFQDSLIAENHTYDFQHSATGLPSPYISIKSRAYSIPKDFGVYINSTAKFLNFSNQRPFVSTGGVFDKEVDIGSSLNLISFESAPSIFYSYKNLTFELFGGVGFGFIFGDRREFKYIAELETNILTDNINLANSDGNLAYIGNSKSAPFGGLLLSYGIKLKYKIWKDINIHLSYNSPLIIGSEYILGSMFLAGFGYSW
jgi:hypothetical protein